MASQFLPPQPATNKGADGAAAVAGYAAYQRSYVNPTPAGESPVIGAGISGK